MFCKSISLLSAYYLHLYLSLVNAHGFVTFISVDGVLYYGANGVNASSNSPMRKVASNFPVTNISSTDLICGLDASPSSTIVNVQKGSLIQFIWGSISGTNWFHQTGPIMTYMTNCKESCVSFIPSSSTEWFKISELGEMRPGDPGSWVQGKVTLGTPVNVSLPLDLPAGEYLVRNEIISLQNAQTVGGAEYYPSCLQISLTLGGNVVASPTVHFPGAYSETDPGILGNFYNPGQNYTFPGGPVSTLKDKLSNTDDIAIIKRNTFNASVMEYHSISPDTAHQKVLQSTNAPIEPQMNSSASRV